MTRGHVRDIGAEIAEALADPVQQGAISRAMDSLRTRRASAWPSAERFEELRTRARAIKEEAVEHAEELLCEFEAKATAAGAVVTRVPDAATARAYIADLGRAHGAKLAMKSKSMTSEEIHLNGALEDAGIAVVEGDLGERIIQLAGERPSHLVVPAIHKSKEQIIALLAEKMGIAEPPGDAEGLTRLVRDDLRQSFLTADMGVTGANFAIAETGSIVLLENEGNICLTSQVPALHVAVIGSEKIIPRLSDLGVFLELLPGSATGQRLTAYVSLITGKQAAPLLGATVGDTPRAGVASESPSSAEPPAMTADTLTEPLPSREREFHIVILDNGRSQAAADPELREALYCIRCGACLNACAPYNQVGGHVYGGDPYPGGIGCPWTYITRGHQEAYDFNSLCTTCSRCTEACPVKIDIPWLNTVIKERNNREFGAGLRQRVFARADLMGDAFSPLAPLVNPGMRTLPARLSFRALDIDPARRMPRYEQKTFTNWWRRRPARPAGVPGPTEAATHDAGANQRGSVPAPPDESLGAPADAAGLRSLQGRATPKVAMFVDCFMNHNLPQVGRAAVEVLESAGVEVTVAHNSCCGRPSLSQGLLEAPRRWAVKNLRELGGLIEQGYDIVCIEPSCLSALRDDYRRLLERTDNAGDPRIAALETHSYDVTEYLVLMAREGRLHLDLAPLEEAFVVHGHCHQKSLGIGSAPAELLRLIPGVTVYEVEALCCGMVGSFGYKEEFSALSQAIGRELFAKLGVHGGVVVACGISCRSQIEQGTGRAVVHPCEVVARALRP